MGCVALTKYWLKFLAGSSVHGLSEARVREWIAISFFRGIFPIQGSNTCLLSLLRCRWIPYQLSRKENPYKKSLLFFSSVQSLSHVRLFVTQWTAPHQASLSIISSCRLPNPCPLRRWCHPTISSSVVPFSSCLQSWPASGSFPMSQRFAWGDQSIGVSASASVLPMNIQDWSPLGWSGWISLQTKGLSSVFSNTTVQKHQFFSPQLSL